MKGKIRALVLSVLLAALVGWVAIGRRSDALQLTGIVTTHEVIASPLVGGRVERLAVSEGDAVAAGDLLAVIAPEELEADTAYYSHSAEGLASQVQESEAALRYEEQQTAEQIRQAEATLAAIEADREAAEADLENARLNLQRVEQLSGDGILPTQEHDAARTAFEAAQARVASLERQADAQSAAVALAHSRAEQVAVRRSRLAADHHALEAADAQREKAQVRLGYSEVRAPIDGMVDVCAVRQGEVVNPGDPLVTLIDPNDLWVRADVEESYIDGVRLGDEIPVRLPSGKEIRGTVFYRGADAGFATQRDVSRSKRDIKTFEIRLRVDNSERLLAVGMTAYVLLPKSSPR